MPCCLDRCLERCNTFSSTTIGRSEVSEGSRFSIIKSCKATAVLKNPSSHTVTFYCAIHFKSDWQGMSYGPCPAIYCSIKKLMSGIYFWRRINLNIEFMWVAITSRAEPMRQWKLHSKPWWQKSGCGIEYCYVEIQFSERPCWSRLCNCSPMHCQTTHYVVTKVPRQSFLMCKISVKAPDSWWHNSRKHKRLT